MKTELVVLSKLDLQLLVIDALNAVLDVRQINQPKPAAQGQNDGQPKTSEQ